MGLHHVEKNFVSSIRIYQDILSPFPHGHSAQGGAWPRSNTLPFFGAGVSLKVSGMDIITRDPPNRSRLS